jgi:hypothetical protein
MRNVLDRTPLEQGDTLGRAVQDRYRCPEDFLNVTLSRELSSDRGYFQFGPSAICYGRSCDGARQPQADSSLYDVLQNTRINAGNVDLPFDPDEIIDNLRLERYQLDPLGGYAKILKRIYYRLRPLTNRALRRRIQRFWVGNWEKQSFPHWPVDTTVESICETLLLLSLRAQRIERIPFVWFWPNGARGCVLMTHDVEEEAGRDFCPDLLDIDGTFGFKTSFQIVPEGRYAVPPKLLDRIRNRGCEIAVHDLNHDGELYDDRKQFLHRAARINSYARKYGAKGFRAGVLYRNLEWYDSLDFSFDMTMPNVAHLDPQRGGCCTVMPYFIGKTLELPVTMAQDYTLFHLLNERSIALWKDQVELVLEKNGLASFIVHPDYVQAPDTRRVYEELLKYLCDLGDQTPIWYPLPSEVDAWWRARSAMSVVKDGDSWRIEGDGSERAVLAFAKDVDGKLVYDVERVSADEPRR